MRRTISSVVFFFFCDNRLAHLNLKRFFSGHLGLCCLLSCLKEAADVQTNLKLAGPTGYFWVANRMRLGFTGS